ncbi:hypothetical protein LCGC14_2287650 [marine sediment metagenome]|uniref:Uncharacterized protein n=1 Tax=marine sediment metagenome TaxID=412755 RepID=A0A0F9F4Q4_9ZZZZ
MNLTNKTDKELWDMLDKTYPKWINPGYMIYRNINYLDNKNKAYKIHQEIIRRERR